MGGKNLFIVLSLILLPIIFIPPAKAQDSYQQQDASAYAKLVEIDEELRRVKGQLEENSFQYQKLSERLDKLQQDIEFRLSRLEKGGQPASTGADENVQPGDFPPPEKLSDDFPPPLDGPNGGQVPPSMVNSSKGGQKILGTVKLGKDEKPTPPPARPIIDNTPPKKLSEKEQYNYAFGLLRERKVVEAISAFEDFINKNPKSELVGAATYWIGEAYYVQRDYNSAAKNFLSVYKKHPKSQKAPDSLLKLAMSLAALDKKKEACTTLAEMTEKFPKASSSLKQKTTSEKKRLGCK